MDGSEGHQPVKRARWRKKRWQVPAAFLFVLASLAFYAWTDRLSIADDFISDQFAANNLPATYEVERIGGETQIISNLVIGNPQTPDLTAKRAIIRLRHRFGLPEIAQITLVEPRIYGRYFDGQLSFGSLDGLLFDETSDQPTGLPDIDLAIRDGRGLLETGFGPVGLKIDGEGNVADGFEGIFAATAPELRLSGCDVTGTTVYGTLATSGGRPEFDGPVRLQALGCPASALSVSDLSANLEVALDSSLADPKVEARLESGSVRLAEGAAESMSGTLKAQVRGDTLTGRYLIAARGFALPQVQAALLTADGRIRSRQNFAELDVEASVEGNGLRLGRSSLTALNTLESVGDATLLQPILRRIASAIEAQTRGSSVAGDVRYRADGNGFALSLPQGALTGGSGARIASISRVDYLARTGEAARLSGNIATGGPGIPRISGRMERSGGGSSLFRLSMAPYEADGSRLTIPRLTLEQQRSGAFAFEGRVEASGPLPGGSVDRLALPMDGRWAPGGELALWSDCTRVEFARLAYANLQIAGPGLTLCPPSGKSMLRYGNGGLRFAAGATALDLRGALGETPIRIASGPVGFAYPGILRAADLDVSLGPEETASRFRISDLDADIGDSIAGSFADAEIALASVPMTLRNTNGRWSYADGALSIDEANFRLVDRETPERFEPLVARGANLTLVDNLIRADAALRNPASDRIVTRADITHDLATGGGYADLAVDGLQFDDSLQPVDISRLALGVVANADGIVTGQGRIDWSSGGDVTSTGRFSSDDLDFAAAFGPVRGASGTIEFTDLLGLTTAPDQTIRVAAVNPGIEVLDGEVQFALRNGEVLAVSGGSWPFMGGRLVLRDVDLNLGMSEERAYVFDIVGLDAAQFIAQMELENIAATGTFDGTIPIIFDTQGDGRIENGVLQSRAPGGNISYVGELSYEDLSPIANFAFDALKSLDYTRMGVVMNGPLTGEIVTQVRFDGVRQGEAAKTNFITRQLAKLPIEFRINIRAQFYQLITSLKSMYDPASVRDPRELGLLDDDGTRLRRSVKGEDVEPDIGADDLVPDTPPIQQQESE